MSPFRAERILFDEEGLLVVDKPPGVVVHGGPEGLPMSLVDRLREYRAAAGQGDYLGVHSRLDVGTSGALLFTTHPDRNLAVKNGFEQKTLVRRYSALVSMGAETKLADSGTLTFFLSFERGKAFVDRSSGKEAITHYRVVGRRTNRALVELELETGRTHQIRASLAHMGAPLIGDVQYGGPPAPRVFLHADSVRGAPLPRPVTAPLPGIFAEWLEHERVSFPESEAELDARVMDAVTRSAPLLSRFETLRLIHGDTDFLPGLIVDIVGGVPWITTDWQSAHGPLLARTLDRLSATKLWRESGLMLPRASVGSSNEPGEIQASEGGVAFGVHANEKPPLALDAREARSQLASLRVPSLLTLGCGPALLGVAAGLGATQGTYVDARSSALLFFRRSLELSGLGGPRHRVLRADPLVFLQKAARRSERLSALVLDASRGGGLRFFARSGEILALCFACLTDRGTLIIWAGEQSSHVGTLRRAIEAAAAASSVALEGVQSIPLPREWGAGSGGITVSVRRRSSDPPSRSGAARAGRRSISS